MKFIFRADSSNAMGHGHIMRCLNLAQKLPEQKNIIFFCQNLQGNAFAAIEKAGYPIQIIPETHQQLLDAKATLDFLKKISATEPIVCIVDHYQLDETWENILYPHITKMVVIDDLANRNHTCDILIDQSLVNSQEDYSPKISKPFKFIGGCNLILRDEFFHTPRQEQSPSIIICMGGSDPNNITLDILKNIHCNDEMLISVVIGSGYAYQNELADWVKLHTRKINILRNVQNMAETLAKHSLAIVSCGTTVLECCALGLPTIGIPIAGNQLATADYLRQRCAVEIINPDDEKCFHQLNKIIEHLFTNPVDRNQLAINAKQVISNNATYFIAKETALCQA